MNNADKHAKYPALLRQLELEALAALANNVNVRIYIGFDKHVVAEADRKLAQGNPSEIG
jgi:hypothetical protein